MLSKLKSFLLALSMALSLTACGQTATPAPAPAAPTEGEAAFAVHYLDVGQADCALVLCDGHAMLIDGGNAEDSNLVYSYLERQGIEHLDYMVASHAHEDHIGGLSGALNYATVDTAFSPVTEGDTKVFQNMVDYLAKQGKTLTVPEVGQTFSLGSAQVTILGPVKEYSDTNDTSIVLSVDYGKTSFLFTGDMEASAEADLLDSGADVTATVLKAGHHGSDTSSSYRFLREVMPAYTVISVGEDNSYGHPNEEILSRLRDVGTEVYRTDLQGTIIAESDGTNVTFRTERISDVPTNPTQSVRLEYIVNTNSKKFHLPTCPSAEDIDAENKLVFPFRELAVLAGYEACGRCKP